MTAQLYRELCATVELVSEAVELHSEGSPFLGEWQKWSRGFLAGLYYWKTAQRAAQAALAAADTCERTTFANLAKAAALVADGVVAAAKRDEAVARAKAAGARRIIEESIIARSRPAAYERFTTRAQPQVAALKTYFMPWRR